MIIQSRMQPTRVSTASTTWTDDEGDDDPWSGYGDTLEMELSSSQPAPSATTSPETTLSQPTACAEVTR